MKIGEKIKYLNQEGTATLKVLKPKTAIVEDENGFEFELDLTEILSLNNEFSANSIEVPKSVIKNEKKRIPTNKSIDKVKEVDLHFGHLVDYPENFSPKEKLDIQLQTAKEELKANRGKVEKLILIHGKGKGKLEAEVYKLLESEKGIRYKDATFQRYKLGAVEIQYI